jgi:uncharacterized tellurite resistance protein B-like protein
MSDMTPLESLHYAIGEIAYAMATADGAIQQEEKDKFHQIISEELKVHNSDINISEIIFRILEKGPRLTPDAYEWATHEIRNNSHYLSPRLKSKFLEVIRKIATAYPPVTQEESIMFNDFRQFLSSLKGDPVFYERK